MNAEQVLVMFLVLLLVETGNAEESAAQGPALRRMPGELLVKFRAGAGPARRSELHRRCRARMQKRWARLGLEQVCLEDDRGMEAALAIYQSDPSVEYAEPDYPLRLAAAPDDPRYGEMWGLENTGQTGGTGDADIDAAAAWDLATGDTVLVAVIDSGVDYLHPDLAANMWTNPFEVPGNGLDDDGNGYLDDVRGWDFFDGDADPRDELFHGTHVAGIIAAVGDNGTGVVGVNWAARIMPLKVTDRQGTGSVSAAVEAILYAVEMKARVINNSWAVVDFSQALRDAVALADSAGVLFVAAAGNGYPQLADDNDLAPVYPASLDLPNVIAVAATNSRDSLAAISRYGATTVDLAAPGEGILSTMPDSAYALNSGTSAATPHVSGVAALLWARSPDLDYLAVKQRLLEGVEVLGSLQGKVATGGRLNARRALAEVAVAIPDTAARYGAVIRVPVRIAQTTGEGLTSAQLGVAYAARLFSRVEVDSAGSLVESGWSATPQLLPGRGGIDTLKVALTAQQGALTGLGDLVFLRLQTADIRSADSTALELVQVRFNQGVPASRRRSGSLKIAGIEGSLQATVAMQALEGWGGRRDSLRVQVADADRDVDTGRVDTVQVEVRNPLSGEVEGAKGLETAANSGVFRAILPTAPGPGGTGGDGVLTLVAGDRLAVSYADSLDALGGTAMRRDTTYVVALFGDLSNNDQVSALDAHRLLRFAVGLELPLFQEGLAGDVDGDNALLAFDASLILQYVVGRIDRFPVQGRVWADPGGKNHPFFKPGRRVIALGRPQPQADGTWRVGLELEEREGVIAAMAHLRCDPGLEVVEVGAGEGLDGWLLACRIDPGETRLALAGAEAAIPGPGELAWLRLRSAGPARLRLEEVVLNSQPYPAAGEAEVGAPRPQPRVYALYPNQPNPFNPATVLPYDLAEAGPVRLEVYDALGQWVCTLVSGYQKAGAHRASWDGRDGQGRQVGSGAYLVRLRAGDFAQTRKVLLLR